MRISDVADLLSPPDRLTFGNKDLVQVPIERVNVLGLTVFEVRVPDHDNIAPGAPEVSRQCNNSVADRAHRIAQGFTRALEADPIFTKVAMDHKSPRLVISIRVGCSERKVKAISEASRCEIRLRGGGGAGQ